MASTKARETGLRAVNHDTSRRDPHCQQRAAARRTRLYDAVTAVRRLGRTGRRAARDGPGVLHAPIKIRGVRTVTVMAGAEPFSHDGDPRVGVLLCHGFTGTPQSLRAWAEDLAAAGVTVSLPRLPGHGTNWREMARTTWHDWYAEVESSFETLAARCEHVIVTGLSMGGTLALRLAECQGERLAGLVLVNPSVRRDKRLQALVPLLKYAVASVAGIGSDIKRPGVTETAYDRVPLRALDSLDRFWRVVRADLSKVTQPVLLFRSSEDHVVSAANTEMVLAGIRSTDVTRHECADSYHVATLDHDAPAIFAETRAFVARVAGGDNFEPAWRREEATGR